MMPKQTDASMSGQLEAILTDIANEKMELKKEVHSIDEEHIQIKEQVYKIVTNYRDGFQLDAFEQRYQDFFDKFDFIVGDWGYEQLRLRGFYQVNQRKVPRDQTINFLDDYLKEYCNFGCQYFVLAKDSALEKYQQYVSRTKKLSVPIADVESVNAPVVSTKESAFTQRSRRRKRTPKPRTEASQATPIVKEDFKIRNQGNQSTRKGPQGRTDHKPVKRVNEKPANERNRQTKPSTQTDNKKAFVIKKKANPN